MIGPSKLETSLGYSFKRLGRLSCRVLVAQLVDIRWEREDY